MPDLLCHLQNESLYAILQFIPQESLLRLRQVSQSFYYCVNTCVHELVYDCSTHFENDRDIYSRPQIPKSLRNLHDLTLRNNRYLALNEFLLLWISQLASVSHVKVVKCDLQQRPQAFFPPSSSYFKKEMGEMVGSMLSKPSSNVSAECIRQKEIEMANYLMNTPSSSPSSWQRLQKSENVKRPSRKPRRGFMASLMGVFATFKCSEEPPPTVTPTATTNYSIDELYRMQVDKFNDAWKQYLHSFDSVVLNLAHLNHLELEETRIQDSGLNTILTNAHNLERLSLSQCYNLFHPNFNKSSSLKALRVHLCRSMTVDHRYNFEKLTDLSVHAVKQVDLNDLFQSNQLQHLSLGSIRMSLRESPHFPELRTLTLQSCLGIDDESIHKMALAAQQLEELTLINLRDLSVPSFITFKNLKTLTLGVGVELRSDLSMPSQLERLILKWNPFGDWGKFDVNTKILKELCFQQCQVSDVHVEKALYGNNCLDILNLSGCKLVNDPSIVHATLSHLDLSQTQVKDERVELILSHCPHLESLALKMCSNVKAPRIESSVLRDLKLSGTEINAATLAAVLGSCVNLHSLEVCRCNRIEDWSEPFKMLAGRNSTLKAINISDNGRSVDDESLEQLFSYFTAMRTLICRWNGLKNPKDGIFEPLVCLDITGCSLDKDYLRMMSQEYPDLIYL